MLSTSAQLKAHLYVVLVLYSPDIGIVDIWDVMEARDDGQVEAENERSELTHACSGSLHAVDLTWSNVRCWAHNRVKEDIFTCDRYLVALFVGVAPIRVGEVDVAIGLGHDTTYGVA